MKELWTQRWKKALIWLSGYLSFIAYALVGGYVIFKTTDKELQRSAKLVFVITLIFAAIDAVMIILGNISTLGARMGSALSWIRLFINLAEIGIYAAGIIVSLFSGSAQKSEEKPSETASDAGSVSKEENSAPEDAKKEN